MNENTNGRFYQCVGDIEEGLVSGDPEKSKVAFRRAVMHVLRMEENVQQLVEMHKLPDGQMMNVPALIAKLDQTHKALFGEKGEDDPIAALGVVEVLHRFDEGRKLACRMFYAIIAALGVLGALIMWSVDIGTKIKIDVEARDEAIQKQQDDATGRLDRHYRSPADQHP